MENYIPENTCRTCLQQSDELTSLYTEDDDTGLTLLEKLRFCVSMQVLVSERTPTNACAPCVRSIAEFCDFKRRCELSEKTLEGIYGEPPEYAVPKIEVVYMEEDGGGDSTIVAKIEPVESNLSCDDGPDWTPGLDNEEKVDDKTKEMVPCDECPGSFTNIYSLKRHKQRFHMENGKRRQCDLCGDSFVHPYELRRHMKTHTHRKAYCDSCNEPFNSLPEMLQHRASAHPLLDPYVVKAKRDFKCSGCGKLFETELYMQEHYARVHQKQELPRDVEDSGSQSDPTADVRNHRESANSDSEQHETKGEEDGSDVKDENETKLKFACKTCGKRFNRKNNLKNHCLLHTGKYPCPVCCERFKTKEEQSVHTQTCVDVKKDKKLALVKRYRHPCDECPGSFLNLKKHKMCCHSGQRHVCNLCGATFSLAQNLRRHMDHTHKKTTNYVCETCGKAYSFEHTLRNHIEEKHAAEKPVHTCNLCGKTYNVLASLFAHKRSHQPDLCLKCDHCERTYPNKVRLAQHVRRQHMKPHACDECDKRFLMEQDLLKHKAIHARQASKPYACKVCEKRFSTTSAVSFHMDTQHRRKKHLKCDVCGMEFYNRFHYAAHYSGHTGVKPCRCDDCGKGYNYNRDLVQHKKTCAALLKLTQQ